MSAGAAKDYTFGRKSHWRRWAWNRIKERTRDRRKALVVGLFGAEALDVPCATKAGFSADNLISVDRDAGSVRRQRKYGVNAIEGDLWQVLLCMRKDPPQVVFADTCSNMAANSINPLTYALMYCTGSHELVLAINLMRGREYGISRDYLHEYQGDRKWLDMVGSFWDVPDIAKNRAGMFLVALGSQIADIFRESGKDLAWIEGKLEQFGHWESQLSPQFCSYRSDRGLVFDSAVLRIPSMRRVFGCEIVGADPVHELIGRKGLWRIPAGVTRKIAAARALRTMRLRSTAA